ncbi:hypothetical protein A9Q81_08715 [Gammaproteobacteria bacterium 42_54_T18]|nr:hypothetical protein A9Q81_08715 [Gammaproteobacteria bacterium 42_54_T18]
MKNTLIILLLCTMSLWAKIVVADNDEVATKAVDDNNSTVTLEQKNINIYDVDIMIDEFKASMEGTVELVLFRPVGFTATLNEMPYSRKHSYLKRAIENFASESSIVATKGITVASATGRTLPVYIIDELAEGMEKHLSLNDEVIFEAYHVYNSKFGPGLLVYSWQKKTAPSMWQQWWATISETLTVSDASTDIKRTP